MQPRFFSSISDGEEESILASWYALPADTAASLLDCTPTQRAAFKRMLRAGVEKLRGDFQVFRQGLWSVLYASLAGTKDPIDVDRALWRLREAPSPKSQLVADHRVGAGFVMSPYPSLPWKNDWTTTDRLSSLYGYPAFELPQDVYVWRTSPFDFRQNTEGRTYPGTDFLHAYWIGRYVGLFVGTE